MSSGRSCGKARSCRSFFFCLMFVVFLHYIVDFVVSYGQGWRPWGELARPRDCTDRWTGIQEVGPCCDAYGFLGGYLWKVSGWVANALRECWASSIILPKFKLKAWIYQQLWLYARQIETSPPPPIFTEAIGHYRVDCTRGTKTNMGVAHMCRKLQTRNTPDVLLGWGPQLYLNPD